MGGLDRRLVPLEWVGASRRDQDERARADLAAMTDDELAALLARLDPLYAILAKELLHGQALSTAEILDLEAIYDGAARSLGPAVMAWTDRHLGHLSDDELEARMREFLTAWERHRSTGGGGVPCAG